MTHAGAARGLPGTTKEAARAWAQGHRPWPGPGDPGPAASSLVPGDPKAAPVSCDVNPTLIRRQCDTRGSWNLQHDRWPRPARTNAGHPVWIHDMVSRIIYSSTVCHGNSSRTLCPRAANITYIQQALPSTRSSTPYVCERILDHSVMCI